MTTYTKRDIRAADMLAMILVGFGTLLLLCGAKALLLGKVGGTNPAVWVLAGVFLCMGAALNFKIRDRVRNGGREPGDYPGVPE